MRLAVRRFGETRMGTCLSFGWLLSGRHRVDRPVSSKRETTIRWMHSVSISTMCLIS
jgi:hypothetical protein